MYVYMYVCARVCVCMYIYIHIHLYDVSFLFSHLSIYVNVTFLFKCTLHNFRKLSCREISYFILTLNKRFTLCVQKNSTRILKNAGRQSTSSSKINLYQIDLNYSLT